MSSVRNARVGRARRARKAQAPSRRSSCDRAMDGLQGAMRRGSPTSIACPAPLLDGITVEISA
ncbi:MAG: hypothetical protein Q8M88_15610 [Phenylobacterium sp.]|uniref:hypothetical protein n=1 Tax=Phenylobacterium sp. TaxID=1871053 RepID=UPI002734A5C3|nr:hypothetical protein [Phenylobacterium sp.]MDP3175855.1 hypothetical protein [Phenylobacterium sp.]